MELRFKVEGMACTACEAAVERAALKVAGVATARADLGQGMLCVECGEGVAAEGVTRLAAQVEAAVDAVSYEARWLGDQASGSCLSESQEGNATGPDAPAMDIPAAAGPCVDSPDALAAAGPCTDSLDASHTDTSRSPDTATRAAERKTPSPRVPRPVLSALALVGAIAFLVALQQLGLGAVFLAFPTVGTAQLAYGALFLVGLMTSVHCVAMCGGLNLSQSLMGDSSSRFAAVGPSLQYNLGRLSSYTAIGAALGLVGSAISISTIFRCVVGVLAGVFMVVLGLSLMGLVRPDALSRLLPKPLVRRMAQTLAAFRRRGPFVLGLANGFMPCGPLQAMQLYALACGGALEGALSMLFFCLGTVPLMFATGSVLGALKARWRRVLMQVGGTLLLLFGIVAAGNGLALAGVDVPLPTSTSLAPQGGAGQVVRATMGSDGIQRATIEVDYGSYQNVALASGVPAQITFHVPDGKLIGCNASLSIPAFDVEVELQAGDTTISLPAVEAGTYPYSCWMGMIKAAITVE